MTTLNEIFSKLNVNVNVNVNSNREIYKKELFTDLNENDLKKARRKIRKIAFAFASEVVLSKTEKSIKEFIEFYKQIYAVNDYSLASICHENTRNEKRDTYANCLQICKDYLQKSNNLEEQEQQTTKRTNKQK